MTKSKEVRALKVGDRVFVSDLGQKFKGTVHSIGSVWVTVVSDIDGTCRPYDPKQLSRRLIKKPRPKPQERERLEFWVPFPLNVLAIPPLNSGRISISRAELTNGAHLVEKLPGEIIIDRKTLAEAFGRAYCDPENSDKQLDSAIGISMLKTLGLEAK